MNTPSGTHTFQCLFQTSLVGILSRRRKKTYIFSPNGYQIVCSKSFFFIRCCELHIYHGNFLLMDNKRRILFIIKQSKGRRFLPRMHQNAFGGRAPSGPAGGGVMRSPRPSSCSEGSGKSGPTDQVALHYYYTSPSHWCTTHEVSKL